MGVFTSGIISSSCWSLISSGRVCGGSGEGDGAVSLIGLIASVGLVGDGCRTDSEASAFFHLVDEADLVIGDSLAGRRFPFSIGTGVCWSANRDTWLRT